MMLLWKKVIARDEKVAFASAGSLFTVTILLVTIACVVLPSIVVAQTPSVNDLLKYLQTHSEVTQLSQKSISLSEQSSVAISLPNPDILIGVDNVPAFGFRFDQFLPTSKTLGIQQKFPNRGERKARAKQLMEMAKGHKLTAQYRWQQLQAELLVTLSKLQVVLLSKPLVRLKVSLLDTVEETLSGRLISGGGRYGDYSGVDDDRLVQTQTLNDLEFSRAQLNQQLVYLLGEEQAAILDIKKLRLKPYFNQNQSALSELNLYPVYIAQQASIAAGYQVVAAESAFKPDFGIKALYKQREESDTFDGDDWYSVQASISVPLWARTRQQPQLRQARATEESVKAKLQQVQQLWFKKMQILDLEIEYQRNRVSLFEERFKVLNKKVASLQHGYESGNEALTSVVAGKLEKISIELGLVKARSHLHQTSVLFNSHIMAQ